MQGRVDQGGGEFLAEGPAVEIADGAVVKLRAEGRCGSVASSIAGGAAHNAARGKRFF